MVRLTDQKMTAIKLTVYFSLLPRGGGLHVMRDSCEPPGSVSGRSEGKASVTTLIVFFCRMKGAREGNQAEQI